MISCAVLVLCAIGAVRGTPTDGAITRNRDRRDTFLDIFRDKTDRDASYKILPVLPVKLPIQIGGHGSTNLPILVLPVPFPVYTQKPEPIDVRSTRPTSGENAKFPATPPYIAVRSFEDNSRESRDESASEDREKPESIDEFDRSPIVVLEEESNSAKTAFRAPLPRRRVKYVVKKIISNTRPERIEYVDEDEVSDTQKRISYVTEDEDRDSQRKSVKYVIDDDVSETPRRIKYVTEGPRNSPGRRVIYVTDDISDTAPRQRVKYVIEDEDVISKSPRRVKYVTEDGPNAPRSRRPDEHRTT
ncbi:uncharacterized protein LOC125237959 [Leguminivora glycinivorella]|uniref:uncharacterized protein LOC125237959 n=1 Tax=Leguminivora glycinivorella TaxID=1035111 RepID=UPI00200DC24A|nr:uncharacterized protein LOC125237959 [Leguminivora glycinivorella]